jgi:hypothetical protein
MKTTGALLAAAMLATLLGCATEGDKKFTHDSWEKTKDTGDQVADETVDSMKKSNEKAQGFFHNLWD